MLNSSNEKRFNDISCSDFIVKCKNTIFHVHQSVLIDRCEYFAALLRNECLENKKKELIIKDFEPHIVEIFLKYIYTSAMNLLAYPQCEAYKMFLKDISDLMQMADKYLLSELVATCDSYLAEWFTFQLETKCDKKFFKDRHRCLV